MTAALTAAQEALAARMPEAELLDNVVALARTLRWLAYHTHDSRRSAEGFPDLVLAHAETGRIVFAELKRQNGPLRDDQIVWLTVLSGCADEVQRLASRVAASAEGPYWLSVHVWRPEDWLSGRIEEVLR